MKKDQKFFDKYPGFGAIFGVGLPLHYFIWND